MWKHFPLQYVLVYSKRTHQINTSPIYIPIDHRYLLLNVYPNSKIGIFLCLRMRINDTFSSMLPILGFILRTEIEFDTKLKFVTWSNKFKKNVFCGYIQVCVHKGLSLTQNIIICVDEKCSWKIIHSYEKSFFCLDSNFYELLVIFSLTVNIKWFCLLNIFHENNIIFHFQSGFCLFRNFLCKKGANLDMDKAILEAKSQ